ncbi:MAG: carboxypeptidase regulatory-like domain-containing protein [Bacteroidetes bacterium]|nr:carboxypeptidase regulatory-like domain-containing protein [Bacteroidota bacterium]
MKTHITFWTSLLLITFLTILTVFNSCKRNQIGENPLSSQFVNATIFGQVISEDGIPIRDATIEIGSHTYITDSNGLFHFFKISTSLNATLITSKKINYFTGYRTLKISANKDHFTKIMLVEKKSPIQFNSVTGGTFNIQNGGQIVFLENSIVSKDGTPYNGTVTMYSKWLNPISDNLCQLMPGDLRGKDLQKNEKLLQTFGMIGVELYDNANQPLQIAGSKTAQLSFPIPSAISMNAPSVIPLWYFNPSTGLWEEEGNAVKIGNNYVGDVSHFTFWNCDVPSNFVNLDFSVIDNTGIPLVNMLVKITNMSTGTMKYDFTNSSGYISGLIPDNANLKLEVLTPCFTSLYSQILSTTSSAMSLGNIIVAIPSINAATITGNLIDCSGNPVNNGFVSFNNYFVATDINGYFNAKIAICTSPSPITIVAYDINSNVSGTNFGTLNSGLNNFGILTACGTQLGYIQWTSTVGSVASTFKIHQPNDYFHCFYNSGTNTHVMAQGPSNTPNIFFYIDGGDTVGVHYITLGLWDQLSKDTVISPVPVNITHYGPSGGFIEGNFTGNFQGDSIPFRTISCQFRVPRE